MWIIGLKEKKLTIYKVNTVGKAKKFIKNMINSISSKFLTIE